MTEKNLRVIYFGVTYTLIDIGQTHITLRPSTSGLSDLTLQLNDAMVFTKNE